MKSTYLITDRAGEWVGGQRRPASGRIELTPTQAVYELMLGTIKPLSEKKPDAKQERKRS